MATEEWVDRLIAAVRKRLAPNQLVAAEEVSGVGAGYLRKAQGSTRNIMLAKFLRICENAGLDLPEIFAEVFPLAGPAPGLGVEVPSGPAPGIVRRIGRVDRPASAPLPRSWLEWLDGLRYDDPGKVLGLIEDAIDFVPEKDLPLALGVWASTCRHVSRYEDGFLACQEGLRLARRGRDRLAEVDLLQRASYLVTSMTADYRAALGLSERATVLCARLGDMNTLGQIMVDQGLFLVYLERYEEAESAFLSGLEYLPEEDCRNRVSALHGIGFLHKLKNAPRKAITYARKASELASNRFEHGKIQWLIASASVDLEAFGDAILAFERAFDDLLETSVVDAGLVVCDHVKVLVQVGKLEEARARAQAARTLMEPLARYPVASAAIRDLIRCEQEGHRLTVTFVLTIRERIEKGRRVTHRPLMGSIAAVGFYKRSVLDFRLKNTSYIWREQAVWLD